MNPDRPSPARIYDYLLGGTHNYPVDREFAEAQVAAYPAMRKVVRANRDFLGRAVRAAVAGGIRQFVDIGSGLPTQGNVHEVADGVAPGECRVVYADNEPMAHADAQVLLAGTADPELHRAIHADFFDGEALWRRIVDEGGIDPAKPVCLLTIALLHFMPPERQPERILAYYREQLSPGSVLALSHVCTEGIAREQREAGDRVVDNYARGASDVVVRTKAEVTELFGDFELLEPGVVWVSQWRPDVPDDLDNADALGVVGGVARKP